MKMVLLRRGFLERGGGCSASDSLLPWGSPGAPSVVAEAGQGWAGSREPPAAGSSCGSTGGCRAMTDSRGYARTGGEPAEEAQGDEGQFRADVFE